MDPGHILWFSNLIKMRIRGGFVALTADLVLIDCGLMVT